MAAIGPRWDVEPCDEAATTTLASALNIEPAVARILCQRGLSDPELADRFLNPALDHLHDPMLLADMNVAVDPIITNRTSSCRRRSPSSTRSERIVATRTSTWRAWASR